VTILSSLCLHTILASHLFRQIEGNGGNSSFLSRLEETADLYGKLSKFEKMECIKKIIADWHGRFFIITPDGSCSQVWADVDTSPSSKLYTSVRRMMNYVIKKRSPRNTTNKRRISQSREKKRLRRIKLEKHTIEQPIMNTKDTSYNDAFQDFAIQKMTKLENVAIQTLASLITGGVD
jgi:hypothetical protein